MNRLDNRPAAILLDEERRMMLAWIDPAVIECYSTLYLEARRYKDKDLETWLDYNLILSASRRGRRADQVLEAIRGEQTIRLARERHLDPALAPQATAPEKKKRGWG